MNPTTLRRVLDNELRLADDVDTLTLPEVLSTISTAAWTELEQECPADRNDRKPMISSLRRNLQREHIQRLMDLVLKDPSGTAAYKPIGTLARMQLRELKTKIAKSLETCGEKMDAYSIAHLTEAHERISQVLEAGYTLGGGQAGIGGGQIIIMSGEEPSRPAN
jgi:hypothetical protein